MKKNTRRRSPNAFGLLAAVAVGFGVGIVVWLALLVIGAFVLVRLDDPVTWIIPAVLLFAAVSAFAAGFAASRLSRAGALLSGLLTGALLLAAVFLISFALGPGDAPVSALLKTAVCTDFVIFSFLGALFGVPTAHKRRA